MYSVNRMQALFQTDVTPLRCTVIYAKQQPELESRTVQLTFSCLKLTIETLEQGVKYVQS